MSGSLVDGLIGVATVSSQESHHDDDNDDVCVCVHCVALYYDSGGRPKAVQAAGGRTYSADGLVESGRVGGK